MAQAHYYGDTVRILLLSIAIIMVVSIPFFSNENLIPNPSFISILTILALAILGGWISPKHKAVMIATTIISAGIFIAFQYYAILVYKTYGIKNAYILVNEVLAILSLLSTYFATKSVRGISQAEGL